MSSLTQIVKKAFTDNRNRNPIERAHALQLRTLKKLLLKAGNTQFGQFYHFSDIVFNDKVMRLFREKVPLSNYSTMNPWWQKAYAGEESVTWPGKMKYFALSSGTSEGASKYIPVTKNTIKFITRGSAKQLMRIARCKEIPTGVLNKHYIMIGGSTTLQFNGINFSGDLSGITSGNVPFWFEPYTKPEPQIRALKDWHSKIEDIIENAPNWDPGTIAGVPAWIKLLFERIIERYNLKSIHDIWPNLTVYIWGGVSVEPYRKSIDAMCGKPLNYWETYLASEGFLAFQARPYVSGMRLLLNNGVYYEFVPFNDENFDGDGNMLPQAKALSLMEVEEGVDYALVITTCSGAWRYIIGDTIRFSSLKHVEIKITGRTKHFLSLCGEHLSVENMNDAFNFVSNEMGLISNEFCVIGVTNDGPLGHDWYVGSDKPFDTELYKQKLDAKLGELNDDYIVERTHALTRMNVTYLANEVFNRFLESQGKGGAQVKFPRVLKGKIAEDWVKFVKDI